MNPETLEAISVEGWSGNQYALIVLHKTGIYYTNQTGGYACNHPVAEGFLVQLRQPDIDEVEPHVGCWSLNDGPDFTGDERDQLCRWIKGQYPMLAYDESREIEGQEGWWPVRVIEVNNREMKHLVGRKAILTTGNCD